MKVVVVGAGVIGVTSAWYLAQAGYEVTVLERQAEAGCETSFANGGQISVSHPEPWASPAAPAQILRWRGREDAPLKFRPRAEFAQWYWGLQFLRECMPGRNRRNGSAIAKLALYSRRELQELRSSTAIEYDALTRGILHLFFDGAAFAEAEAKARWLRDLGMEIHVVDRAGCVEVEPALAACRDTLHGGLYAPQDESGDARRFCLELAKLGGERGIAFRFGTTVEGMNIAEDRVSGMRTRNANGSSSVIRGDIYVLCLGSYSGLLAREAGERLPIYPVKGYSITFPLLHPGHAPHVSITDESRRIVCSRLGDRLRAAGMAELNGYDLSINAARCQAILRRIDELFPGVCSGAQLELWAGLRPTTPGNLPIIGRSRIANLYFNTGHGSLGWTLACGSGRALSEIVAGRVPEVAYPFRGVSWN